MTRRYCSSLTRGVESNINYGLSNYPDPKEAAVKRAKAILEQMQDTSARATQVPVGQPESMGSWFGERTAGHYSPRAQGYEMSYGPYEQHIIDILKREGDGEDLGDSRCAGARR